MTNCLMEAILQKTAAECKCAPSCSLLGFDLAVTPVCSGTGMACFNDRINELGQLGTIVDDGVEKPCLAPCEDQQYRFETSSMQFPNRPTFIKKYELLSLSRLLLDILKEAAYFFVIAFSHFFLLFLHSKKQEGLMLAVQIHQVFADLKKV
jgi:hypothetical protein